MGFTATNVGDFFSNEDYYKSLELKSQTLGEQQLNQAKQEAERVASAGTSTGTMNKTPLIVLGISAVVLFTIVILKKKKVF